MKVSDLRNAFETGRPLVEQSLSVAVQMAALRTWCRERQVDWQQVKSLLKAQIQDAEEGTDKRVKAILEKADNATAYAEELGLGSPEKNISRVATQQAPEPTQKPVESVPAPATITARAPEIDTSIPSFLAGDGMNYPSSHSASPISQSAHNAPTISVIGRAFNIQNFLPLTSGLQLQRTLNTPPGACGRKLGTTSLAHVMARTCRRSATQYKPTGGSFAWRRTRCR